MAGVWTGEEKRIYTEMFCSDWEAKCGTAAPNVVVLADIELVQFAALAARSGIVLIAGTGSMALGVTTTGSIVRCGGWGPRIDDAGGGFWLGREAIRSVAQMIDGIGPSTALIRPVAAWLRTDANDVHAVAARLRSASIDNVARLASAVTAYAEEGDAVAVDITTRAALALATLAKTLLRTHSDLAPVVVCYGSVWHSEAIRQRTTADIVAHHPDVVFESVDDVLTAANRTFLSTASERINPDS
jgi:N-acetylglucosamine kinase-like BadF-type ATPase